MSDWESLSAGASEGVVKGYDPAIMRKLLAFIKPYSRIVIVAIAGMLLATGAELLQPVVLQKTIDNHIVVDYSRVSSSGLPPSVARELKLTGADPTIDGYRYFPSAGLAGVAKPERARLIADGLLDTTSWYLFPREAGNLAFERLLAAHPTFFSLSERYGAVPSADLALLTPQERSVLRAHDVRGVALGGLVYLALLFAVLLFSFAQTYLMSLAGQRVMKDIRLKLLDHTLHQSYGYLSSNPVGGLVSRVTNDVETINDLFTSVAATFFQDVTLMIGAVATLFFLNTKLALIALCSLPPVILMTLFFRLRARDAYRRVRLWVSQVTAYLSEHIAGVQVVQMFGRELRSAREFVRRNAQLLRANLAEMYVFAFFRPLTDLFASISLGVVLYFGAGMFISDSVSLGVLIAFLSLITKFYQPVMDISEKFTVLQSAMAGGERVFDLLETQSQIPDHGRRPILRPVEGRIGFENVYFAYKGGEPVLKGLSFEVQPGESVAIVGYTGAGKTTVTSLLTRLWDADSGSIKLDGVDIRDYPLPELRRVIQPVQQDVFIFSGTVTENIALGSEISDDEVRSAAAIVHADAFIERLPGGYDARLAEGGTNLSTGQRQLLSFARVIAHDPAIIVLDEATASIDTETERLVQEALERVLAGRTSIIIAHRLSTIRHCDRILALSGGVLVEEGTHQRLLANQGLYATLYRLQYEPSGH